MWILSNNKEGEAQQYGTIKKYVVHSIQFNNIALWIIFLAFENYRVVRGWIFVLFFFVCASQQLSLVNERYTHFRRTPPFWFILPSYFCMLHSSKKKLIHSGNFPFLLCLLFMYQTLPAADVMSWIHFW